MSVLFTQFSSKVARVKTEMLYPEFWINNSNTSKRIIICDDEIKRYNERSMKYNIIEDIFLLQNFLEGQELRSLILSVSKPHSTIRYKNGLILEKEYFLKLSKNLNLEGIKEKNLLRYGMVTRRSHIKSYPTDDRIFKNPKDYDLDRLMETAINICDPCVILHESKDKEWYFVKTYGYKGWIKRKDIAIGEKEPILKYTKAKEFLVVTGRRIYTGYNPFDESISMIPIDMGVKLSLVKEEEILETIYDMYPCGSYVVWFPTRRYDGSLKFTQILISRSEDICYGYLPYTEENIIRQSFKCLGERYGWGGEFFGRDCSSLVVDVFKTMGLMLPRNSSQQEKKAIGITKCIENMTIEEKKKVLDTMTPGCLMYLDGHVVIYLGKYYDEYFIIHDTIGFYISRICSEKKGDLYYISAKGVAVTPLTLIYTSDGENYLRAIKTIKIFG